MRSILALLIFVCAACAQTPPPYNSLYNPKLSGQGDFSGLTNKSTLATQLGNLQSTNNLSDLGNLQTARTNLGIQPIWVSISDVTIANTTVKSSIVGIGAGNSNSTLSANRLVRGGGFRIHAEGTLGFTSSPTLTMTVNLGAFNITGTGAIALQNAAGENWIMDVTVICRDIGVTGDVQAIGSFTEANSAGSAFVTPFVSALTTIDTTTSNLIACYAKWSAANSANTITCNCFTITPIAVP